MVAKARFEIGGERARFFEVRGALAIEVEIGRCPASRRAVEAFRGPAEGIGSELDGLGIARGALDVLPQAFAPAESVERKEKVALVGDELDRAKDEFDLCIGAVVGERDAHPPWLDADHAARDLSPVTRALL